MPPRWSRQHTVTVALALMVQLEEARQLAMARGNTSAQSSP